MARAPKGKAVVEKKNAALGELKIEYVEPGAITPNAYNPNRQNTHEFDLLCKSIEEDGFTQPVLVGSDGHIVDGEHRWRAAQHLGLSSIPIVRVPMDSAQARIATLRHNRARGSEDLELSVAVLRDLEQLGALDWAADSLDLSDDELNRLLEDVPAPEALAAEEFSPAWEPGKSSAHQGEEVAVGNATVSSTPAALSQAREHESRLRDAKTEQEREAIQRDRTVYRVALSFSGDEAVIVKRVLGESPAEALLRMCQAADQ
jgi:ParB/RepB/Spo0J family partition protein